MGQGKESQMIKNKKRYFTILTISACLGATIALTVTLWTAMLRGGSIIIDCNTYHEGWIEAVLLVGIIASGIYIIIQQIRKI